MIKFTLNEGEVENALFAAGTHYDRDISKDYKIAGKRSPPSEDGRISAELKISYASMWADIELTGVFDPEENSLRGIMLIPHNGVMGEFVFKRHPDLVRFYPAPSITGARERWEFATTTVLDRIRRKAWSSAYILKRIRDRKRYIELSLRFYYGRDLNEDEQKEFSALCLILSEADVRFCASLIRIKLSETPIFSYVPTPMYCLITRFILNALFFQGQSSATTVAPLPEDRGPFAWTAIAIGELSTCVRNWSVSTPRSSSKKLAGRRIFRVTGCSKSIGSFSTETRQGSRKLLRVRWSSCKRLCQNSRRRESRCRSVSTVRKLYHCRAGFVRDARVSGNRVLNHSWDIPDSYCPV